MNEGGARHPLEEGGGHGGRTPEHTAAAAAAAVALLRAALRSEQSTISSSPGKGWEMELQFLADLFRRDFQDLIHGFNSPPRQTQLSWKLKHL